MRGHQCIGLLTCVGHWTWNTNRDHISQVTVYRALCQACQNGCLKCTLSASETFEVGVKLIDSRATRMEKDREIICVTLNYIPRYSTYQTEEMQVNIEEQFMGNQ